MILIEQSGCPWFEIHCISHKNISHDEGSSNHFNTYPDEIGCWGCISGNVEAESSCRLTWQIRQSISGVQHAYLI